MSDGAVVTFPEAPPATYSSLALSIDAGERGESALFVYEVDALAIELVLDEPRRLDLRCDEPVRLDAGDRARLGVELDAGMILALLRASDLPEAVDGVVRVDRETAPEVVRAVEDLFASTWSLRCRYDGACFAPRVECDGRCVDLSYDEANCGECGRTCGGDQTCVDGLCTCEEGLAACDDACVDLATDPNNCGACGRECAAGGICEAGDCACPGDQIECGGHCTDVMTDPDNCGRCGRRCEAGTACVDGNCSGCPPGLDTCPDGCVDLDTDEDNCGECGHECPERASCERGACRCPGDEERCGERCVDLSSDPGNCGACGVECDLAFGECRGGRCGCVGESFHPCGPSRACVAILDDPMNCGGCGRRCREDEYCDDGECRCRPGLTECGGRCVDTSWDRVNCGECGHRCRGAPTGGSSCYEGECVAGCPEGTEPCDEPPGSCVPLAAMESSPNHCGGCSIACAVDEICAEGRCWRFEVGRGCSSCPCPECEGRTCCDYPEVEGLIVCVDGDLTCP